MKAEKQKKIKPRKKKFIKNYATCSMCFSKLADDEKRGICKRCLKQGERQYNKTVVNQIEVDGGKSKC